MPRKTKMNCITSPDLIAQVNQDNINLKNDFLNYLHSINRSEGTINGYSNDLDIFFVWVLQNAKNKHFVDITKRDIVAYQNWLINNNENGPARIRRLKSAISSLSNFVENILDDEKEFEGFRSIVKKIENPVLQPVREKTVLDEDELYDLLDKLLNKNKIEQACFLALAMFSGRRKAELARFKVSDFDNERLVCGGSLYKSAPIKTKGRGGGKYISCYTLAKDFDPYLTKWIEYRNEHGIESEWLFPSKSDNNVHITIGTANSWANTFSRMLGKDFYFHALRHWFTTRLAKAGIPDGVIQSIVAWESADMVRLYTDIDADEQIGMYFDENGIKPKSEEVSLSNL